jgi:hypothetical protein
MRIIKKYLKDWLIWVTAISVLVIVVILAIYFIKIGEAFDWGDFGNLLVAITGLIAFIGVLFTLRQNKLQSLNSEDRSVFFDLLKIFISYRDDLRIKKMEWKYLEEKHEWDIKKFNDFCMPEETFWQIYVELYHTFYLEIRRTIPKNFTKKEFRDLILSKKENISPYEMLAYCDITFAIDNIYLKDDFANGKITSIRTIPIHLNRYDYICLNAIKFYIEQNNLKPITDAFARAADHCFAPYKNQLGTYFRNAYYILDMVSEFNSPKNYAKIFRAQLSKYELVTLFFNSFGSLSNPKTRELYLNADLFNNLELKDIRLKEGNNDESISRMDYIIFPPALTKVDIKSEFVSCDFLKKLYDSINEVRK